MSHIVRAMFVCAIAFALTSCGGAQRSGLLPEAAQSRIAATDGADDPPSTAGRVRYVAIRLPATFVPSAMMPSGRIPGSTGRDAAVFFRHHVIRLGSFGNEYAVALGANSRGDAVGVSTAGAPDGVNVPGRALLFSNGTVRQLTGVNGADFSDARAIDDDGHIYGGSGSKDNLTGPRTLTFVRFSRARPAMPVSPNFGINDENPDAFVGINRFGFFTVTRAGEGNAEFPNRGYLGFGLSALPVLSSGESSASDLNDFNQVVGVVAPLTAPDQRRGYLHDIRGTRFLSFEPVGINNHETIVGLRTTATTTVAVVYFNGTAHDVNTLLSTPLTFSDVLHGISDEGAFVAQANNAYYLIEPADRDH